MDKKKLAIAIPASTISDTPHLREKTAKIGLIGRAAAIFRVDEIIVYPDNPKVDQRRDLDFIALLLNYLETPQYLRKRLFKLEPRFGVCGNSASATYASSSIERQNQASAGRRVP